MSRLPLRAGLPLSAPVRGVPGVALRIPFTLYDADGAAYDLTGLTARVDITDAHGKTLVSQSATVDDSAEGEATLALSALQTTIAGEHSARVYVLDATPAVVATWPTEGQGFRLSLAGDDGPALSTLEKAAQAPRLTAADVTLARTAASLIGVGGIADASVDTYGELPTADGAQGSYAVWEQGAVFEDVAGVWTFRGVVAQRSAASLSAAATRYGGAGAVLSIAGAQGGRFDYAANWAAAQAASEWASGMTESQAKLAGLAFDEAGGGLWVRRWDGRALQTGWAALVRDAAATLTTAKSNLASLQDVMDAAEAVGGCEVHVTGDPATPLMIAPDGKGVEELTIPHGVTLVGSGSGDADLQTHASGLDGTGLTNGFGIFFGASCYTGGIRDLCFDQDAETILGATPDAFFGTGKWFATSNNPPGCSVVGVAWNTAPSGARISLTRVVVKNCVRSCFVGNGVAVTAIDCHGENSLGDHVWYVADGDNQVARSQYPATLVGCTAAGYARGPIVDVHGADAEVRVLSLRLNPVATMSSGRITCLMQSAVSTRPFGRGSRIRATVTGELDVIASAVAWLRGPGGSLDLSVEDTSPSTYGDTSTPALLVNGADYEGWGFRGNRVRLDARNLGGQGSALDMTAAVFDEPVPGLDLDATVRLAPGTPEGNNGAVVFQAGSEGSENVRLRMDVRETGGGAPFQNLLTLSHAAGHISVLVENTWFEGQDKAWLNDGTSGAATSSIAARDCTFRWPTAGAQQASLALVRHQRVRYFTLGAATTGASAALDGDGATREFTFPHGHGSKPDHVRVTATSGDAEPMYAVYADATDITVVYTDPPPPGIGSLAWSFSVATRTYKPADADGLSTQSGDGTTAVFVIPHGLVGTPSVYGVEPQTAEAQGAHAITADATHITITYFAAPASEASNLVFRWYARIG